MTDIQNTYIMVNLLDTELLGTEYIFISDYKRFENGISIFNNYITDTDNNNQSTFMHTRYTPSQDNKNYIQVPSVLKFLITGTSGIFDGYTYFTNDTNDNIRILTFYSE